ncbi:MAG: hypothetical protein AB1726_08875 [Planctomycetota bacterium]
MSARAKEKDPHPGAALETLRRAVASEGLARAYVLRGEEPYFRERALEVLVAAAEAAGWEVRRHAADREEPEFVLAAAIEDLSGGGLFAARRLVILREPGPLLAMVAGQPSPLARAIDAFLTAPVAAGSVVLAGAAVREDLAVVKAIRAAGGVVLSLRRLWDSPAPWRSPDPRQVELVQWLVQRARERGLRLDPAQAVFVCAATGNDLAALDGQLERLRGAAAEERREAVGWTAAGTPWKVAEDLLGDDVARAIGAVETLFAGGFHEKTGRRLVEAGGLATIVLNQLAKGVRQRLALAWELSRGADDRAALRAAGFGGGPQAGEAAIARARGRDLVTWRAMLEEVSTLERRLKTGSPLDANDFVHLALRWARLAAARGQLQSGGSR